MGPFSVIVTALREMEDILVVHSERDFDTFICRRVMFDPAGEQSEAYFREFQKLKEAYKLIRFKRKYPRKEKV